MKRIIGIPTIEEARQRAASELWQMRPDKSATMDTETETITDKEGKLRYETETDSENETVAYILPDAAGSFLLALFAPGEHGRYTLPFRGTQDNELFALLLLNAHFVKPARPMSVDEALTEAGYREIEAFFDCALSESDSQNPGRVNVAELTAESLFDRYEDEDEPEVYLKSSSAPLPETLTAATGRTIRNARGYAAALSALLRADLRTEEADAARKHYTFMQSDRLIKYALYELLRTEDYAHLTQILSGYASFGLSAKWEKAYLPLQIQKRGQVTAAQYVLSCYLCKAAHKLAGKSSLREIAEYIGAPLKEVIKSSTFEIWDF